MKSHKEWLQYFVICGVLLASTQVNAAEKTIEVHLLTAQSDGQGIGEKIGTITFSDSKEGLIIHPQLKGLSPGDHGFHIHEKPSCNSGEKEGKWVAGLAAGGHLDPHHTDKHLGPKGEGHLGDLPVLVVDKQGEAQAKITVKRLTLADIKDRSIVIHQGGDNYSDHPPMGGGGDRIACGVIS